MHSTSLVSRRFTPELLATVLIVLAYVVWLMSMPAWPSQDGPVHLYYTHVLSALISHGDPVYAKYFTIRHALPPYALYYYALVGLSSVFPPFVADRLIVCAYVVSFVFGFRYLARSLGPSADTATLLATPLILNWSLGMGFVNFCLSLSFGFWAIGLWLRFADRRSDGASSSVDLGRRIGFVFLAVIIMLTHPVPLALVVVVCSVFLLVNFLQKNAPRSIGRDVITLAIACLTLVYVKLFATSHPLEQVEPATGTFVSQVMHRVLRYVREDGVVLLFGHTAAIQVYRIALGLLLIVPLVLAVRQRLKNREKQVWTHADTMLVLGLLLLVLLPLIPSQINGLFYFADRLPLLVWITLLLAASGVVAFSSAASRARVLLITFALIPNGALLFAAEVILRPVAASIAAVENTPITLAGQSGFIMEDPRAPASVPNGPSWNPFYWAAIHVVQHNDAVLANAPWMNETILPIGPTPALPEQSIPALQTPVPKDVAQALRNTPLDLARTLASVNFFVTTVRGRPSDDSAERILLDAVPSQQNVWYCRRGAVDWYRLCTRQPQ